MRAIELTRGQVAIVDDEDFLELAQYRWFCTDKGYASRNIPVGFKKQKQIYMHRVLCPEGELTDHKNGNTLDNRRCNLRPANKAKNAWNSKINKRNTSGFKGVSFCKTKGCFVAYIGASGERAKTKRRYLGKFQTAEEAHSAYCAAAKETFGNFARLN